MRSDDRERNQLAKELHALVDELLDAWQRVKAARAHLERFQRENSLEVPSSLTIEGLADYTINRRLQEDEEQRRAVSLADAEMNFREKEREVLALLPEGVPLAYEYGTYGTITPHGDYEIRKVSSGGDVSLETREARG